MDSSAKDADPATENPANDPTETTDTTKTDTNTNNDTAGAPINDENVISEEELAKAQKLEKRDGGTGIVEDAVDNLAEARAMIG